MLKNCMLQSEEKGMLKYSKEPMDAREVVHNITLKAYADTTKI